MLSNTKGAGAILGCTGCTSIKPNSPRNKSWEATSGSTISRWLIYSISLSWLERRRWGNLTGWHFLMEIMSLNLEYKERVGSRSSGHSLFMLLSLWDNTFFFIKRLVVFIFAPHLSLIQCIILQDGETFLFFFNGCFVAEVKASQLKYNPAFNLNWALGIYWEVKIAIADWHCLACSRNRIASLALGQGGGGKQSKQRRLEKEDENQ